MLFGDISSSPIMSLDSLEVNHFNFTQKGKDWINYLSREGSLLNISVGTVGGARSGIKSKKLWDCKCLSTSSGVMWPSESTLVAGNCKGGCFLPKLNWFNFIWGFSARFPVTTGWCIWRFEGLGAGLFFLAAAGLPLCIAGKAGGSVLRL